VLAIAATRVEHVTGSADERKLAHVLSEQKRTFAELPLDYEGRLVGIPVHRISRNEEVGHHTGNSPAVANLHRPRELQVRLRAGARYRPCSGREPNARCHRKIEFFWDWTDLPFYRGGKVGKSRRPQTVKCGDIAWQINQHFEAWRDTQP
jgi:hypothetical protein